MVGTNEAAAAAAITAKGVVVVHKTTAPVTKPTAVSYTHLTLPTNLRV